MSSTDLREFLAGWIGGAAGVISSHPLDTVKVRLQTSNHYKGTADCVIKTMKKEGVRGFFKGMSFPLMSAAAYNAVVFGVYSNTTKLICEQRYNDANHTASYFDMTLASMITGAVSVSVGSPVDLVKIRLQAQTGSNRPNPAVPSLAIKSPKTLGILKTASPPFCIGSTTVVTLVRPRTVQAEPYRGVIDCLFRIYKENGIRGFYKGGGPAMLMRDIPGYVIYFLPYAVLCNLFQRKETGQAGPIALIAAGGIAGVLSWGMMHPVDTIKSRIQLEENRYRGVVDCARTMYRNEGMQVFFRGLGVNALRGFPQSAALFFGYEMSMRAMKS